MPKINSNSITFVDITDSRKLEVYITSNLPTTQIKDSNTGTYSPDWSTTNLQLTADVYLDSEKITPKTIQWYTRIGTTETLVGSISTLKISTNTLADNPIITYICRATYQNIDAFKEITFMRTDTGINGSNGNNAPMVVAQYSVDGATSWTSTLNTTIHKYIRHSYDGGKTWSAAIKMVGEDGTSVAIKGTATSVTKVSGTDYYTLVYSSSSITSAELGDSYLYNGDLYVCADSRDGQDYFINVGNIQGPTGNDGKSSYVFIRYATDSNGTNMSTSPSGKTYMGVYISDTNVAPTTASLYTWSKFVGDNAKSIVLSGDSQVFKVSQSNAVTPSTIKVTAQVFNTTITSWTYSTNGGQTFLSTVPTGVSRNGNIVTVTGSSITSNSLTIKASDGTIEDVFTVYKAFDGIDGNPGDPGDPAPIAFLTNENVTFSADAQGRIAGTTITSNIVAYSGTTKVTPTIGEISDSPTGMTITSSTITASKEVMLTITISNNSTLGSALSNMGVISIPVTYPVSTVLYLTWSKVNTGATGNTGAPAYTAMLTNESHIFAGDIANAIDGFATTQIIAYKGATEQAVTLSSVNGKAAATVDTDTGIAGLKFKCSALSGTSPTITFTCTTSFVSANGTIPIVFTVDGVTFTKIFTYSIAFKGKEGSIGPTGNTGSTGAPATSYWLVSSASVVQKTSTGTIAVTPSTLTFTGKSQTGTATPVNYACRWIVEYSTDGTNYTNLYTSSANEASKSITVATTYKTIRARMYLAGGTATLLDEQIIPVVSDGAKGDIGNTGRGVSSITEQYYQSTSATAQSGGSWSATVPTWVDGEYIWTRSVITYTDSTTSTTSPICITGQKGGTGVGISSVDVWYYQSTSATSLSGGSWSTTAPTWSDGKYVWTKTITTYTNSTTDETTAVCITGQKGATGVGIKSVTEYYLATASNSGVTTSTTGWTTAIQTITIDKKYLWNYEIITYTDNTTSTTTPIIIGTFGNTGKGVKSVTEYYLATTAASGVTTATTGWTTTMQTLTVTNKYLWNYELITYTDNTTATISPVIIGVYGDKGDQGNQGPQGNDAYTVILTNESHVFAGDIANAITANATTQVLAYKGSTSQSVTIVSVNGKTASTSSTATGIAGLSFACSALSGTSPTITFSCTTSFVSPSGTIPIVITVGGITMTKMFTYSIAFKGSIGSQGSPGTPASLVDITPSAHYFKSTTGKDGTFTPDYIYLYPRFQTVTYSKWEYSTNGGTSWTTVTSGSNGLTIGTYSSVSNSLRIAKTSALYTDSITSISFRCVSSNASVYDTVSIAKIYDVVDLQIITFQIYAPKGYLLTNSIHELTLEAFAYDGGNPITGATFVWSNWDGEEWITISDITGVSLTVNKNGVFKSGLYRCQMTYNGEVYTATATVDDKTDVYESLVRVTSKYSSTNRHYWILYATAYSDEGERDALLGPISEVTPTNPANGDYWYKIDETNYTVTLMKYSGTEWATATDSQEFLYDWVLFKDTDDMVTFGQQRKVVIVTSNDFSKTCDVQCNIFNANNMLLSRNKQSLIDPSDPVVSQTAPQNPVDGQLWMQLNNGSYVLYIWNGTDKKWIMSEADSQNKVYVEKPTSYSAGDIWIVGGDYQPTIYLSGAAQTTKYLAGTMLKAQYTSSTYKDSDWVEALNYKKQLDEVSDELEKYKQYISIDDTGLIMEAKAANGQISEFKTKLTNTELGFYQGDDKVAYINNNQLNISKAQITNGLSVSGASPVLTIGGFSLIQEDNGSLSIITNI